MGLREFTGGFDLRKLGRASATRVSGWLEERDSDQFVSFTMWVSQAKRPKILALDLVPIPRPAAFPIRRLTEAEAIAGVEALLRKQAVADRFSGAALVAKTASFASPAPTARRIANEGSRTRSRRASASAR